MLLDFSVTKVSKEKGENEEKVLAPTSSMMYLPT